MSYIMAPDKIGLTLDRPFPLPHGNISHQSAWYRADGMIRSRIESARALPPSRSCQPSGMNWEQKIVDARPHRYSISSKRSLLFLVGGRDQKKFVKDHKGEIL